MSSTDSPISNMPVATTPTGVEVLPMDQGGATKKVTVNQILTAGLPITGSTVTGTALVGTLSTASQPNITSLGTLSSLHISGALTLDTDISSSVVDFLQAGTGAVTRTVRSKEQDVISAFDFMSSAQIADVKAGTASIDVTAAIQAAINSLGSKGGTILFPGNFNGTSCIYLCASGLVLDGLVGIVLQGQGSTSGGGNSSALLKFTGTGTCISARSINGFICSNLALQATNAANVGHMIDLSHSVAVDSQNWLISRCVLIGSGAGNSMLSLVNTERAIIGIIKESFFTAAPVGILARSTNSAFYANSIQVLSNTFALLGTMPIRNPGQGWLIQCNTFEQLSSGNVAAIDTQIGVPFTQTAVSIIGNWFGDGNSTGTWISMCGSGMNIKDNYFSTGARAISIFNGGNAGVVITGNAFDTVTTAIDFNSVSCTDALVWGNSYSTVTNRLVNTGAVAASNVSQVLMTGSPHKRVTVTYSASMTLDTSLGDEFDITVTDGNAFSITTSNPIDGQRITVTIRNASGGAAGAVTWNVVFKMSTWTQPANANSRSIDFKYNGTNWVQVSQTGVDVPN